MKKMIIVLCLLTFVLVACKAKSIEENTKNHSINEEIEWSHTWVVSTSKSDLPKVLIVGDSHVEAYYPVLEQQLKGKAYCSKFTTSRSLGDPMLKDQLENVLKPFQFDIIVFNNGLHGSGYSEQQYEAAIEPIYNVFKSNDTDIKLIYVNTIARRKLKNLKEFHGFNDKVIIRNKAMSDFTKLKQIPLVEVYTMSYNHPEYYKPDGVHFNEEGVTKEANVLFGNIMKAIKEFKL